MSAILWALELGLTSNQPTLRDVEHMTKQPGGFAKHLVPEPISDTTLDTESQRLDCGYLHNKLVQRVRGFHRSKMLEPEGLPCGVMTVDGKSLATLCHDADGSGHARSKHNEKRILDGDGGLTSFKNASVVVDEGYDDVFGLKGNQQELFGQAQALLLPLAQT